MNESRRWNKEDETYCSILLSSPSHEPRELSSLAIESVPELNGDAYRPDRCVPLDPGIFCK